MAARTTEATAITTTAALLSPARGRRRRRRLRRLESARRRRVGRLGDEIKMHFVEHSQFRYKAEIGPEAISSIKRVIRGAGCTR